MPTNPCCCTECTIYHDKFTTDSLALSWTNVSGSWSIAGGVLSIEDAAALLIANEPQPDGDRQPQVARASIRFDTAEDVARLIVAYDDVDNYLFTEFWIGSDGCGHVQMYERIDGVDTPLGDEYALPFSVGVDAWTVVSLCYFSGESVEDPGILSTRVVSGSSVWAQSVETSPDLPGDQGGLGTGATVAGTIDFDNFDYLFYFDAVDHPSCPKCSAVPDCFMHDENFNRSDSTTVGCAWEEVDGDWEISSNELTVDEPNAVLRNRTQLRDADGNVEGHVSVQFKLRGAAGAIGRVILDYTDIDNYFFVQFELGSNGDAGRVTFWRRTTGSNTQIQHNSVLPGLPADETAINIRVCWRSDGIVRVLIDGLAGFTTVGIDPVSADPFVGLGTGDSGSSQVWFDDFLLRRMVDDDHISDVDIGNCASCELQGCGLFVGDYHDADNQFWIVEAGSWSEPMSPPAELNGGLNGETSTADSDALLYLETGHPQTTDEGFLDLTSAVYAEFFCEGFGSVIRAILGYQDVDNYLFGEFESSPDNSHAGYLRVGKVEAGTRTVFTTVTTSVLGGQPHLSPNTVGQAATSLRVCYDGYEIRANLINGSFGSGRAQTYATGTAGTGWNPGKSAIATGTITDTVYFGTFRFVHDIFSGNVEADCVPCTPTILCLLCGTNDTDGTCLDRTPPIVLVRFTGIPDTYAGDYCPEMGQFNDTFALPFYSAETGEQRCTWQMQPHFCDNTHPFVPLNAGIVFQLQQISGYVRVTASIGAYRQADPFSPYGFASATWIKQLVIDASIYGPSFNPQEVPPDELYNRDCTTDPVEVGDTNWGVDCLAVFADWLTIAEGQLCSTDFVTGTAWLSDVCLAAKAEAKILA